MFDLDTLAQAAARTDSAGAKMFFKDKSGAVLHADGWIMARAATSPECVAAKEKNRRASLVLLAKDKTDKLYDADRMDRHGVDVLVAAYIGAGPAVTYKGAPLSADNIAAALADPKMRGILTDPLTLFINDPENFPMATAAPTSAVPTPISSATPPNATATTSQPVSRGFVGNALD